MICDYTCQYIHIEKHGLKVSHLKGTGSQPIAVTNIHTPFDFLVMRRAYDAAQVRQSVERIYEVRIIKKKNKHKSQYLHLAELLGSCIPQWNSRRGTTAPNHDTDERIDLFT